MFCGITGTTVEGGKRIGRMEGPFEMMFFLQHIALEGTSRKNIYQCCVLKFSFHRGVYLGRYIRFKGIHLFIYFWFYSTPSNPIMS